MDIVSGYEMNIVEVELQYDMMENKGYVLLPLLGEKPGFDSTAASILWSCTVCSFSFGKANTFSKEGFFCLFMQQNICQG